MNVPILTNENLADPLRVLPFINVDVTILFLKMIIVFKSKLFFNKNLYL